MNLDRVAEIARAVLYEGYILYPYRPSAIKNRQRWTFGGVFPRAYAKTEGGDPWHVQTQCLLRGDGRAVLELRVRFLQIVMRDLYKLDPPLDAAATMGAAAGEKVAVLEAAGTRLAPWEEAIEREIIVPELPLARLRAGPVSVPFGIPAIGAREAVADAGRLVGYVLRTGAALCGSLAIAAEEIARGVYRLTARIENTTPWPAGPWPAGERHRDLAQRVAFASTHTILGVRDGAFLSLIDPPAELGEAAAACVNQGAWPVLVGGERDSDTMLAAPIILYDNPQIAPESPGDLFDGTEIDEILTLRIPAMTDAEKQEMAAADSQAHALLERVEALTPAQFGRLHGTLRRPGSQLDLAPETDGRRLAVGAHVRLAPKRRADIMDIALEGQEAVLVDTAQRGEPPGTISVVEPELPAAAPDPPDLLLPLHDLDPAKVLRVVALLGGTCRRILLVACEPLTFGEDSEGAIGLSPPVTAALDQAVATVEELIAELVSDPAMPAQAGNPQAVSS